MTKGKKKSVSIGAPLIIHLQPEDAVLSHSQIYTNSIQNYVVKLIVEGLAAAIISAIYWGTFQYGPMGIVITALSTGALSYFAYPISGGFINPILVFATFFAGIKRKLGYTLNDRILRVVGYFIVQWVGSMVGLLFALFVNWVPGTLLVPSYSGLPAVAFISDSIVMLIFAVVFIFVTDPIFAYTRGVVEYEGKIVNYHTINSYFGVVITFLNFGLSMLVGQTTGGALNPLLSGNSNLMLSLWTKNWLVAGQAGLYWLSAILPAVLAGVVVYFLRYLLKNDVTYPEKHGRKKRRNMA